jgi:hypothetical protein
MQSFLQKDTRREAKIKKYISKRIKERYRKGLLYTFHFKGWLVYVDYLLWKLCKQSS